MSPRSSAAIDCTECHEHSAIVQRLDSLASETRDLRHSVRGDGTPGEPGLLGAVVALRTELRIWGVVLGGAITVVGILLGLVK